MEAHTTSLPLRHAGLRAPSPLLRLQGDEKLIALTRKGHPGAYEVLVARYQARLLAFCRHMLSSREDAEDVLQEVFAAAYRALLQDERPINVRPWLYRIARNRSLNHLRKQTAIGVDSMDVHLADGGQTTAEQVHRREDFRQLVADVQTLPETQRTALLLREIDALSYEQIAEAMETTVPSVKSLLVRARVSLAEAAEARKLTCEEVRDELGEWSEGLGRVSPPVRRHLRGCERCSAFKKQLSSTNKALAAVFPVGPLLLLKKFLIAQGGMSAGSAAAAGTAAAGSAGAASALTAGASAIATKTAAGLAAAAIVTAGAVEVDHARQSRTKAAKAQPEKVVAAAPAAPAAVAAPPVVVASEPQPGAAPAAPVKEPVAEPHEATAVKADAGADAPAAERPVPVIIEGQDQPAAGEPAAAPLGPQQGSTTSRLPHQPGVSQPGQVPHASTATPPAPQPIPTPAAQPAAAPPADPAPAAPAPTAATEPVTASQPAPAEPVAPVQPTPAPAPQPPAPVVPDASAQP
ncbi:RNA polymerase sigma factor [Conexibacter sp. SYSU D00693]|uniref:RNA polymerase sigma factor n=1 Tax=Conexibacter sp. SYSU D00693 TaxID=2812560 RepID=UPI00196ABE91|nr:sigma-70 family RNA polymerase sigma factor [Conexibacter sp. SYSU D00693]